MTRIERNEEFVTPGAHYELCREAILEMLTNQARIIKVGDDDSYALIGDLLMVTARGIQADCGMSDIEYEALLSAASF
jgi:hypothetical protein